MRLFLPAFLTWRSIFKDKQTDFHTFFWRNEETMTAFSDINA